MGVMVVRNGLLSAVAFFLFAAPPAFASPFSDDPFWIAGVFAKGGFMMWPILFCSILAVAIFIERFISLRRSNIIHPQFINEVRAHWEKHDFAQALKVCRKHDVPISRILRAGLLRADLGVLETERAVEGAGGHEATWLISRLRGLGVIASITPMLGLLGTVSGLIRSFGAIATSGPGNPSLVAGGVAEALIATAAGLMVGILALGGYHFLRGRTERLILEMEEVSIDLIEGLLEHFITEKKTGGMANEVP
ncbi:MAG: MotA/TolQ/ExbB proton channel family protein [Nitrospinae bacterium]|nr:MotA/TolQ/ExbB proton channel family protein [Nitrospinota bacterium]